MLASVEYYPEAIVILTRGLLDYLTLGRWHRVCTLDEKRRVLEERIVRPGKVTTREYPWRMFDTVDYSYKQLASRTSHGTEHELEEFSVGLRWAGKCEVLPLALFRKSTATPVGLGAIMASFFPASWTEVKIPHEVASRSLANMLCLKMGLKLAM